MKKIESFKPTGVLADMIEDFKKDLLLKDLAARIPYGVKVEVTEVYWDGKKDVPIGPTIGKTFTAFDYDVYVNGKYYQKGFWQRRIISVKPYLRKIDDMTEMEKVNYESYQDDCFDINGNPCHAETDDSIDFLNGHYFDYRGLLGLGLALEAPKGMYNFEDGD